MFKQMMGITGLLFFFGLIFASFPCRAGDDSQGGDHASPVALQAKSMVEAVYDFIIDNDYDMDKVQTALMHSPEFLDNEKRLYIFMHAYDREKKEAVCIGQGTRPELVGKNMWHLRTPNGRHLFAGFMRLIETKGQGWIEYDWLEPYDRKIRTKVSFIKGIELKNRKKAWIGCGYWKHRKKGLRVP
ncbi:MAG: cache domain-containing protein [Thermodesulfobacteriota bacterium]|nr:cache domain-containing protein [Thermodesulfobacteriota bacterium]